MPTHVDIYEPDEERRAPKIQGNGDWLRDKVLPVLTATGMVLVALGFIATLLGVKISGTPTLVEQLDKRISRIERADSIRDSTQSDMRASIAVLMYMTCATFRERHAGLEPRRCKQSAAHDLETITR